MIILPLYSPSIDNISREYKLKTLPYNANPALKPLWDGNAWKESINVTAPNGRLVPVDRSNPPVRYFFSVSHDEREIVSVPENPIDPNDLDQSYRIASVYRTYQCPFPGNKTFPFTLSDPVDYAQYGFTKIGKIWVAPKNERDVAIATAQLNAQGNESSCIIQ